MMNDPRSPPALLKRLCVRVTGLGDDTVQPLFQQALRTLASDLSVQAEADEFQMAEKIKRKLARQGREKDAAVISELHRKLQSQGVLKNRWSCLSLLLCLSDNTSKHRPLPGSHIFASSRGQYATSTPMTHRAGPQQTPAVGGSTIQSGMSTGSSGISSIHSGRSGDPTPVPQSFAPSHLSGTALGQTPYTAGRPTLGQRLALSLNRGGQQSSTSVVPRGSKSVTIASTHRDGEDNVSYEIPEAVLLREMVYVLQGIDGQLIKWDINNAGYRIDDKAGIARAVRQKVTKLAECGWLYTKIRKYADARSSDKAFGLVGQSFCAALHQELTEYYRLIAVLEAQLQQEHDQGVGMGPGGLTLRQLSVWTFDPLSRLKALAALVDVCKGKKGGALATVIHSYLQHGDPFMRALVKHTLTLVAQPIFGIVLRWLHDGELEDTYHEFFVASDPTVKDERLWHDKYSLRKSMIPSFLNMDQARKILLTGKSINFLRQLCQDRTQIKRRDVVRAAETTEAASMFTQDLDGKFQAMIDTVYEETSRHLLEILHTKYKLMDHLKALRRYLLLGQGDFIRHLMDLLEEDLAKPAGTLYLHNLTGVLETAVRATNAQYDDADILKRLDVRLLEVSPGDTGWDVFSLDYHVDGPIRTVFTPECMIMYLRVFNFLWRAKRMEYILAGVWKGQMSNARMFRSLPELAPLLHQCQVICSEMVHFVQQVQYYINFEVLECSWDELLQKVKEAKDLDHIIAAHQVFLDNIITRCLLDEQSRAILTQLRTIFDLIIQFQEIQDRLYQAADDELTARHRAEERAHARSEKGEWGLTDSDEQTEERRKAEFLRNIPSMRAQVRVLAQSYQDMVQKFLLMLAGHADVSLRFLSFRLDFNEYYKAKEPKLRSPLTYQRSKRRT
ncbi:gamma-tubulin complex component 3 homolog [Lingula anatina]|uniref:Gamma-tubulin complex component 3 homolog n=1 Tax=Lingula anatina TaxID=7574 RepID=A0A1S3K053_LINAN|nr:gamma-tubulin complex component 3 homolog [Lingula anatina]|eukprot:XP_013415922.1 gamma-tubulin complex component 3 homolog [Lingula anatina]